MSEDWIRTAIHIAPELARWSKVTRGKDRLQDLLDHNRYDAAGRSDQGGGEQSKDLRGACYSRAP